MKNIDFVGEGQRPSHNLTEWSGYYVDVNCQILHRIKCSIIATAWEGQ